MLLTNISKNPEDSLNYCERRVNNGSRSQFTEKYLPKNIGNPFNCESFKLSKLNIKKNCIEKIGNLPHFCTTPDIKDNMYIHPDLEYYYDDYSIIPTDLEVIPTSSSRTVKVKNYPYYIKLCYPERIGRVTRELDERHIYSSLEITEKFQRICNNVNTIEKFAFMPEYGGLLFSDAKNKIGYVVRSQKCIGKNSDLVCNMIPGFSLFSKDRDNLKDKVLLLQLISLFDSSDKYEYVLTEYCYPLIDIFFNCVMQEGIIPELHSQNIIFGFDKSWKLKSIIIRDLESHDKDISIMKQVGINHKLDSYPFKCIEKDQYNYKIKHSFMFDHKLGEYLLEELLLVVSEGNDDVFNGLCYSIKKYVNKTYGSFITNNNFFPEDGKWYKFKNIIVDRKKNSRPYECYDNPLFR